MKAFTIFPKHLTSFRRFSTTPKAYKFQSAGDLRNKSVLITGASRGIGLAIGTRLAKDGANVTILAKSVVEDPRIPGTIYTAAAQIQKAGGNALALQCDIRDEAQVRDAVEKAAKTFGGIDILINNASAISLTGIMETEMKRYDLMQAINTRGTFVTSKYCLSYLLKAENPHILNLAPPLDMQPKWFGPHVAYSIAKFGMSLCVLGMSDEFKDKGVAVNALWPRTLIATAAVKNVLGGDSAVRKSRTEEIVADAAYVILSNKSTNLTGQFFIDEDVLRSAGVTDFSKYRIDPTIKEEDLATDLFLD